MSQVAKQVVWYLGIAAIGVALGFGCSAPPEDEGDDPTLNAAAGCVDEACNTCAAGYTAKDLSNGAKLCSQKQSVEMPILTSFELVDSATGAAATSMTMGRLYRIKVTAAENAVGGVTAWALGTSADQSKYGYLCKLVTIDMARQRDPNSTAGRTPVVGATIGRISDPFSVNEECISGVKALKARWGTNIAQIRMWMSFDTDNLYDVYRKAIPSRRPAGNPFFIPWAPRERFTPVRLQKPDAGYDGAVNDAGLALLGTGQPDEFGFLNQRSMQARVTANSRYSEYATLPRELPDNIGPAWDRDPISDKVSIEGTALALESSVIRLSPRYVPNFQAYVAEPTVSNPKEFIGTFSFGIAGAVPQSQRGKSLLGYPSSYELSLALYIRPLNAAATEWQLLTQPDDIRVPAKAPSFDAHRYMPFLTVRGNAGPEQSQRFAVRVNNVARQKVYREWFASSQFEVSACPIVEDLSGSTKMSERAGTRDANAAFNVATGPEDFRCKRTKVVIERLPLGRSSAPPLSETPNEGNVSEKPAGNGGLGTSQGGSNSSSCTRNANGTLDCALTQSSSASVSGAFQATLASGGLSTSAAGDGSSPVLSPPNLEVFGFNLLAGLRGDSVTDSAGGISFPVGQWFQSMLLKDTTPRPMRGGIEKRALRPGQRVGIAYVLEKAWPPFCGAYGCIQVIVSLFAGGVLDAAVTITPQTNGNVSKIPCAGNSVPDGSRCFVSYPGEGDTVNDLSLSGASSYCAKFGGRLARLRDAAEELKAATAETTAVAEWNRVLSHRNKQVEKKGWLGFEKTMQLNYDPYTCQDIIDNGRPASNVCTKSGLPNGPLEAVAGERMRIDETARCTTLCRDRGTPFYGLQRYFDSNQQKEFMSCGCQDSYGYHGIVDASLCDKRCNGVPCGGGAQQYLSVSSIRTEVGSLFTQCYQGATPIWGYPRDEFVLERLSATGAWVPESGAYNRLAKARNTDSVSYLDATGSTVAWNTGSSEERHHPICEFEKATSVAGAALGLSFTPGFQAGGSLTVIYGNRHIAGIGVRITLNFISVTVPLTAEFNTVSAVRNGQTIITGGSSFAGDFNIEFLSGSLGVVLYTAIRDFEFPLFNFNGIQFNFPLFRLERIWRYK
jgi:hypothetical protein